MNTQLLLNEFCITRGRLNHWKWSVLRLGGNRFLLLYALFYRGNWFTLLLCGRRVVGACVNLCSSTVSELYKMLVHCAFSHIWLQCIAPFVGIHLLFFLKILLCVFQRKINKTGLTWTSFLIHKAKKKSKFKDVTSWAIYYTCMLFSTWQPPRNTFWHMLKSKLGNCENRFIESWDCGEVPQQWTILSTLCKHTKRDCDKWQISR